MSHSKQFQPLLSAHLHPERISAVQLGGVVTAEEVDERDCVRKALQRTVHEARVPQIAQTSEAERAFFGSRRRSPLA